LMKAYMPTVGSRGLDMMFRTCTIQVGVGVCGGGGEGGRRR
jgi:gamma-glutamylcysteine synthetase